MSRDEAAGSKTYLPNWGNATAKQVWPGLNAESPQDQPMSCLTVRRLQDGGYGVGEPGGIVLFASTTIEEALEYVSDRLGPKEA